MKFYELSYSADLQQMGMIPQISYYEIEGKRKPYDELITYHSFAGADLKFKGNKKLEAKFTDLMTCAGLSTGKGLLISKELQKIISGYNLPDCTLYDFDISEAGEVIPYYYLHILFCYALKKQLDYTQSVFYIDHGNTRQPQKVDSWDDWWKKNQEYVDKNLNIIIVERLAYKGSSESIPGIIRLPFSSKIFISALLKKQITDKRSTGIVIGNEAFEMVAV